MIFDPRRGRLIAVREDHPVEAAKLSILSCALDPNGDESRRHGHHIRRRLSSPTPPQPGRAAAGLAGWDHPNMPWDGTELWVGELAAEDGTSSAAAVAGGPQESIFQPEWAPDGTLYFVSDRTGWWNLYRRGGDGDEAVAPMEAEFGRHSGSSACQPTPSSDRRRSLRHLHARHLAAW